MIYLDLDRYDWIFTFGDMRDDITVESVLQESSVLSTDIACRFIHNLGDHDRVGFLFEDEYVEVRSLLLLLCTFFYIHVWLDRPSWRKVIVLKHIPWVG